MVGNDFDIHYYTSLAHEILAAFNKCFLNKETAQYGTGSQCSNALPLFLQMTQDSDEQGSYQPDAKLDEKVLMNLIKDVEAHEMCIRDRLYGPLVSPGVLKRG